MLLKTRRNSNSETATFEPVRVLQVELCEPLPTVEAYDEQTGKHYRRAISLVRLDSKPIGVVHLTLGEDGLVAQEYAEAIWQTLSVQINENLRLQGLLEVAELGPEGVSLATAQEKGQVRQPFLEEAPSVSIVVATHNRTASLARCLQSLMCLDYPDFDIFVVDNAPSTAETEQYIAQQYGVSDKVKYLRDDRPGLAIAHNCALKEIKAPIVAFTDDDVVADRHWLSELVRGFYTFENVACVTGMIFPAELETQAQVWTEQKWSLCKGFTRRVFDLDGNRPPTALYPYKAGLFGSGANMAFKTAFLREIGGFDCALGAGTIARGGDDLAAFFQVIRRGYRLVYESSAIVHHWHRRDYAGLRRQAYGYGVGLTAYLSKLMIERPWLVIDFAARLPLAVAHALRQRSPVNEKSPSHLPRELRMLELLGNLYGPAAYLRSRWHYRDVQYQEASS